MGGSFEFGGAGTGGGGEGLTEVITDGVTCEGNGTIGDPITVLLSDALVIVSDAFTVTEDTPLAIDLFANDTGDWEVLDIRVPNAVTGGAPDIHAASSSAISVPGHGEIVINEDGTGTITPSANVAGVWPTIRAIYIGPSNSLRHGAINITVTAVNDAPVARDIAGVSIYDPIEETLTTVTINLYAAMSDPDGDAVTLTLINATSVVNNTPIDLDGGSITVNTTTGIGVITLDTGRTDPVEFTYTVSDGTLTDTGNVSILVAEIENEPMISPVSPHNASNAVDVARLEFFHTYMQEYGPLWPYIGPPDGEGNLTLVTIPPYGGGQGQFSLNTQEPWLYDRCKVAYQAWKITGDPDIRDVAIEWIELYFSYAGSGGTWTAGSVDPNDPKYKYGGNSELYKKLVVGVEGKDPDAYTGIGHDMYVNAMAAFPPEYDAASGALFTERNLYFTMNNCLWEYYRQGGDAEALANAELYVDLVLELSTATGAPLHGHNKHEGSATTVPITSAWMGAFLVEGMLQAYRATRREEILQWIYDYALFIIDEGLYIADHNEEPEFAGLEGLRIPAYLFGVGIQFPEGTAADMRHCRDVGELMNKAVWAGEVLELDTTAIEEARDELRLGALVDDEYWTRETPLYPWKRINPPRSHGWQYVNLYALVYDTGAAPPIPAVISAAGTVSGSTQQGATLTFTPPTFSGTPTPTNAWQWYRGATPISSTNDDLTYVTTGDDVATNVGVRGTLTNDAGVVSYTTNTIAVVPAGAPEISVQPVSQSGEVAAQLTFTSTANGIPDPTAIVQRWNGSAWATDSSGTLSHNTVGDDVTATWETDALVVGDNGDQIRFLWDNGVGDDVPSNAVTISVVSVQPAMVCSGSQFVRVSEVIGSTGFLSGTFCGWFYVDTATNNSGVAVVTGNAGRYAGFLIQDTTQYISIGDSQTGIGGGFGTQMPQDTWCWCTFRFPTVHSGGVYTATYRAQGSGTTYTMTRNVGVEDSVNPETLLIGYLGSGSGATIRAQHVRAFGSRLSDQACIDEMTNFDPTAGSPIFFIVASDAGGGTLAVTDESGNAATITISSATYSASGPLTGGIL